MMKMIRFLVTVFLAVFFVFCQTAHADIVISNEPWKSCKSYFKNSKKIPNKIKQKYKPDVYVVCKSYQTVLNGNETNGLCRMVATEINGLEEVARYYYATKKLSCSLILDDYVLIEGLTAEDFKELEGFVYHPKREHFIVNQLCDTECKKFIAGSVDLIYKISPGKFSATVTDQISGFSGNLIFTVKNGLIEILETRKIVN